MEIIIWLLDHPLISLNALEKQCNIPQSTLSKCLSGDRKLPKAHEKSLTEALRIYGYRSKISKSD